MPLSNTLYAVARETAAVICIAHTHCMSAALAVAKRQHLIRQQPDTLSVLGPKTGKRACRAAQFCHTSSAYPHCVSV